MIYLTFTEQHHWFLHFLASQDLFPSQTQLSPLLPGVGMEPQPPFLPVNLLGVSDTPSKDQGQDGSGGGRCPIQGIQSPGRANVSWPAPGCQTNSLTREQKSGQENTNLSLEQLVWPFLRIPKKQQDISCKTFPYLFEQPMLFNDLKSPVPSVLSPSSITFKPKWLFHHLRITLCLTAVS